MKCGHLFNGIGGFALSAHWMGWENVMHCEIDSFCNKVMNYHFPNSIQHEDIRNSAFSVYMGKLDILTGGFPCQPYSTAGKRKGKDDARHLWPEMLRAIREIQPRWVVGENVRGLISWNEGMVFEEVQSDLEAEGYEVQPFLLPAASVGAPHRRDRIFFVAHSRRFAGYGRQGDESGFSKYNRENKERQEETDQSERLPTQGTITDPQRLRCERDISEREALQRDEQACREAGSGDSETGIATNSPGSRMEGNRPVGFKESSIPVGQELSGRDNAGNFWEDWPTQPPLCTGNDGFTSKLDGITFSKWKKESIKAAGNAIVPQVALQIFKAIDQYERYGKYDTSRFRKP